MTKCIVLGGDRRDGKKSIEFLSYLEKDLEIHEVPVRNKNNQSCYEYIELICRNYAQGRDLMFAYDCHDNRGDGCLYIGHWNDGVV